jgi:membrane protease YdiL (CAAX protease family)
MSLASAVAACCGWTFVALLVGGVLGVGSIRAMGLAGDGLPGSVVGGVGAFVGFLFAAMGASRAAGASRGAGVADGASPDGAPAAPSEGALDPDPTTSPVPYVREPPAASGAVRVLRFVTTAGAALCLSFGLEQVAALLGLGPIPFVEKLTEQLRAVDLPVRLGLVLPFGLCPALGEELFFRRALWRRLQGASPAARAGLTSLLFGLAHIDPRHVVAATILGAFLAAVRRRTDGFARCVGAHLTTNAVFVLGAELDAPERPGIALAGAVVAFAVLATRALRDPTLDVSATRTSLEPSTAQESSVENGSGPDDES